VTNGKNVGRNSKLHLPNPFIPLQTTLVSPKNNVIWTSIAVLFGPFLKHVKKGARKISGFLQTSPAGRKCLLYRSNILFP
jgi:hypothetical protein